MKKIKIANGQGFWGDSIDAPFDLIKYGNKNSLSDGAVSTELLMASIKGAYYNVKINLKDIEDPRYLSSTVKKSNLLLSSASAVYKDILKIIDKEL